MDFIKTSWKAFMPILVAAAWSLGAQFLDIIAANYDGGQTWIVAIVSSLAVWLKANATSGA